MVAVAVPVTVPVTETVDAGWVEITVVCCVWFDKSESHLGLHRC